MSQWPKSYAKPSGTTSKTFVPIYKKCKECGSEVWACFSDDFGKTWTCWGHRKGATAEERGEEDARELNKKNEEREIKRSSVEYRKKVQRKRRGLQYGDDNGQYDYFFD
jgi:hypothetical protein